MCYYFRLSYIKKNGTTNQNMGNKIKQNCQLTFAVFPWWANETVGLCITSIHRIVAAHRAREFKRMSCAQWAVVARWTDLGSVGDGLSQAVVTGWTGRT